MATTLRKLSSQIIEVLSGGDQSKDSQLDDRMMYEHIRQAMAQLLKLEILDLRAQGDRTIPQLHVATYLVASVIEDTDSLEASISMPDIPITLPWNKGVVRIFPRAKPHERLIRVLHYNSSRGLPAGGLECQMGYFLKGNKAVLVNFDDKDKFPKGAIVELLVPFPGTQDVDTTLPITPEHEDQVKEIVAAKYRPRIPQDKINDNADLAELDVRRVRQDR